jgi:hypothetical protein
VQQLAVFSNLSYAEVMHMSLEERTVLSEVIKDKMEIDAQMAGLNMAKKTQWL